MNASGGKRAPRRKLSDAERSLWREAMRDVAPIAPARAAPASEAKPAEPAPQPVPPPTAAPTVKAFAVQPKPAPPKSPPGVGLDRRSAERLRRGQMEIDARIDLHGLTQAEAHDALHGFVRAGWERGRRCVLVITGKGSGGEGVLRAAVPRWLAEPSMRDKLLAVTPAQPKHGGGGAFYVLIRRRREGPE